MKIRPFSPEAQQVIDGISALSPDTNTAAEIHNFINDKMREFYNIVDFNFSKDDKQWRDHQLELSIFFSYCMNNPDTVEEYKRLKGFQRIKSGDALKDPRFVTEGLRFGIIQLSPDEINYLIQNNK